MYFDRRSDIRAARLGSTRSPVRHLLMSAATLLFLPVMSSAQVCEPRPFTGSVKRVVVSEADADFDSGSPLRPLRIRRVIEVAKDGRTSTEIETYLEQPSAEQVAKSFTVTRHYDPAGRLTAETLKSDRETTISSTTCEYDTDGRLVHVIVKSANPQLARTITYRFGPSWRTEQVVTSAARHLITTTLDNEGRPLSRVRVNEATGREIGYTEYRYLLNGVEECGREVQGLRKCRTAKFDVHGNEIEAQSDTGLTMVRYEYDEAGNWTKRLTFNAGRPTLGVFRKITYW
jgi:YD repeat-containing protein